MKYLMTCLFILSVLTLSACVQELSADDQPAYQTIAQGNTARLSHKRIEVITRQSDYDDVFYQTLNRTETPETIDFEHYQVLLILPGQQPLFHHQRIIEFKGLADHVQLSYETTYRHTHCQANTSPAQPWLLVKFPKVNRPMVFIEKIRFQDC